MDNQNTQFNPFSTYNDFQYVKNKRQTITVSLKGGEPSAGIAAAGSYDFGGGATSVVVSIPGTQSYDEVLATVDNINGSSIVGTVPDTDQVEFFFDVDPGVSVINYIITSPNAAYGTFFIAPYPLTVVDVYEVHEQAASSGATLQIQKLTSGQSPGLGVDLLETPIDLSSTANIVQKREITNIVEYPNLLPTDRLALVLDISAGDVSGLRNMTIVVQYKYQY